jgi:hypothetical protein
MADQAASARCLIFSPQYEHLVEPVSMCLSSGTWTLRNQRRSSCSLSVAINFKVNERTNTVEAIIIIILVWTQWVYSSRLRLRPSELALNLLSPKHDNSYQTWFTRTNLKKRLPSFTVKSPLQDSWQALKSCDSCLLVKIWPSWSGSHNTN